MAAITIDGEILEGGGQILRNGIALSCLLKTPITVKNIRGKRSNPGLRPQHLTGIQLVCELCSGTLSGDKVGSATITFQPSDIKSGKFTGDTKTAGSVCLLIQVALPCLIFAPEKSMLLLRGGTNADMAPQIDFFLEVFGPVAEKFGVKMNFNILRRGFFPKGNGEVEVEINPVKEIRPVDMTDFGTLAEIRGKAFVAGALPIKVASSMAREATRILRKAFPRTSIQIDSYQVPKNQATGTGTGIMIIGETSTGCLLSGSGLGKKGVPAEQVGARAAEMLIRNIECEACVDEYLQDQVILFMALAAGQSAIRTGPITLHTKTAIYMTETLTEAKFSTKKVQERDNGRDTYLIECHGVGLKR